MNALSWLNRRFLAWRDGRAPRVWPWLPEEQEPPLRSELFSADQMEQHGRFFAISHTLASGRAKDHLLTRLAANERTLLSVCDLLTSAAATKKRITPAGEWLLDNFHLIEEQIRTAKRHLPEGHSRELPRLDRGPSAGHPRVYDIALEVVSHGDGYDLPGRSTDRASLYEHCVRAIRHGLPWGSMACRSWAPATGTTA